MINYQDIAGNIGDLPPMPIVAIRTLELLQDPDTSIKKLAETISLDPAVSARMLKISNSSMYGLMRQITTLHNALVILGERTVRSLVLASSMASVNKKFGLLEKMLWEESVGAALAGRYISRLVGRGDADEAFLAGLFSNLGKVVRNNNQPERYRELIEAVYNDERLDYLALESEYFDYPYYQVGAAVLNAWQIAPLLVEAVCYHRVLPPAGTVTEEVRLLAATVNLAVELCRKLGIGCRAPDEAINLVDCAGAAYFSLDADQLAAMEMEFANLYAENREAFVS
ncbi:MAG: HDOD domain-containing protein [Desulfuromonas sp.]|jgi:HD-like signal output (HDOD) protein|nr:HDOD domain-containing protein [Desulfuromonas thiophila]MDY0398492.1 HDOD domain-containing protein [Desulfuromonas thiophila]